VRCTECCLVFTVKSMMLMLMMMSVTVGAAVTCCEQVNSSFPPSTKTMTEAGNLTVVQLSREDAGVYECIASNHIATVITSTLLIIERKTAYR